MVFYMIIVFLISLAFKYAKKRFLKHLRPREEDKSGLVPATT